MRRHVHLLLQVLKAQLLSCTCVPACAHHPEQPESIASWLTTHLSTAAGQGPAAQLLQFAKLASPQEALAISLIDRVVPTPQLLPAAEAAMADLLKLPDWGRQITKKRLYDDFGLAWEEQAEAEAVEAWAMLESPTVTTALGGVLARLQGKAKL